MSAVIYHTTCTWAPAPENRIHSNSRQNHKPHITCPCTRAPAWARKPRNFPLSGNLRNIKIEKILIPNILKDNL
jgi:hypothetical protein